MLLQTDFGVLALRRCHSLRRNNASSGVRIFFIVGFGTIKNRVQQFLHTVSGKICIFVPNSSMKMADFPRGASNPVVLYGWIQLFYVGFSLRSIPVVGVHDRIRSGAQLHGKKHKNCRYLPLGFGTDMWVFCRSSAGLYHMQTSYCIIMNNPPCCRLLRNKGRVIS